MVVLASAENLVTLFVGLELLSIPLYALCATELRRATSLEAGLKYLIVGSLGSATLLYGLAMIYGATGATDFGAISDAIGENVGLDDPLLLDRHRAGDRRPGVQGLRRAVPPVVARRLPGRSHAGHGVHGHGHEGRRVRGHPAPVRPRARDRADQLGPGARRARRRDDRDRQRRRAVPALAQAAARVVGRRAGRLPARRRRGGHAARDEGDLLLPRRLPRHERRRVRRRDRARAGVGDRRRPEVVRGARPGQPAARVADDDRDARARRVPGHRRIHRKVLFDRRRRGRRLRVARSADRGRLDDLARVLPARRRRHVDGRRRDRASERQEGAARRRAGRPRRTRARSPRSPPSRSCAARPRSSSGSSPRRCSTWRATSPPRSRILV